MVLMVVVTLAVGILQLDPLGTAKLPKWVEMLAATDS